MLALKQAYQAYEFFHNQVHECEEVIQKNLKQIQEQQVEPQSIPLEKEASHHVKKSKIKKTYNRSPYHFDAAQEIKKITKADLTTIPGISESTAMKILSEIGTDMSRWRNAKAFASWLGLCPGNKISGGKILSSKTKPSDNKLAQALRLAAFTLFRSSCYLGAFFRRMRARLGSPKAITATAHKLAKILYRMLITGEDYRELGENYYEQQHRNRVLVNLQRKAKEMGYNLIPLEA